MAFGETQFSLDEVRTTLDEYFQNHLFITTTDLADMVGCTRETARLKLTELVDTEELAARKVGATAKVWYPASFGQTTTHDSLQHSTQLLKDDQAERVLFFPSRREIVVHHPTKPTQQVLSATSHLVDSTGDGYLYKISQEDVWTSPYDTFDSFRDDLLRIIDPDAWTDGFESRLRDDWNRANTFTLVTHTIDGREYTHLECEGEDAFEFARRKLTHNNHYTQFPTDTSFRIKQGAEASVKETLYDEGYPVVDERRLDKGDALPIQLKEDIRLREYQQDWVTRFTERNAGVFVGPPGSGKTIAALGAMESVSGETLILVPSVNLANQWEAELLAKTTLTNSQIGQYHGEEKRVRPVTIATYQTASMTRHRELFNQRAWGIVVADECLTSDTELVTQTGRTTFGDLDNELRLEDGWTTDIDLSVQTFDPISGDYQFTNVNGIYKAEAPVERISTRDGRSIKSTSGHTHLKYDIDSGEIVESNNLKEGDYLVSPRGETEVMFNEQFIEAEAELTGWAIGDGSRTEYDALKFSFSKDGEVQISIIRSLCEEIGLDYSTYTSNRGDRTIRIHQPFDSIPYDGPVGEKTNNIRIPPESYLWNDQKTTSLLRGLFDAEGWVDEQTNRVQFSVTSEGLTDDYIFLLRKLGFAPRKVTVKREEPHNNMYRVVLPSNDSEVFIDVIGSRSPQKLKNAISGNPPHIGFPLGPVLKDIKQDLNISYRQLGMMMGVSGNAVGTTVRKNREIPMCRIYSLIESLYKLAEVNTDKQPIQLREDWGITYAEISNISGVDKSYSRKLLMGEFSAPKKTARVKDAILEIINGRQSTAMNYIERLQTLTNVSLTEVKRIESVGTEPVYDFETSTHTFLANGFLTHNCHHAVSKTWKRFHGIQSTARLGLTATPVRETGEAKEIYTLIGPPLGTDWNQLFEGEWVSKPVVEMVMVPWASDRDRRRYQRAEGTQRLIEAAKNPTKAEVVQSLLADHVGEKTIVFADWIEQGEALAEVIDVPFIYGETPHSERERLFDAFREQDEATLLISRVGDEGIDLPDAEVAILTSTMGSSRAQTGQRAGRTMRPVGDAQAYVLLTKGSGEEDWGRESTQYLSEKGIQVTKHEWN